MARKLHVSRLSGATCCAFRKHQDFFRVRLGGRPSAFLYSGRDVADYVLYPWGQIVRTKEHPDERFTLHLMGTFCKSSFICSSALGSPFAFSEASAARQLSPSLPQNLGSIPRNPL